jgi:hypothetical protein
MQVGAALLDRAGALRCCSWRHQDAQAALPALCSLLTATLAVPLPFLLASALPPPLPAAIKVCGPGVPIKELGRTIHAVGDKYGYGVVKTFVGHGVGTVFHSWPHVSHHRWVPAPRPAGGQHCLHGGASRPTGLAFVSWPPLTLPMASHTLTTPSLSLSHHHRHLVQEQRAGLAAEGDDLYN